MHVLRLARHGLSAFALAVCAACTTTGQTFDTEGLRFLVPGQTTLQEASELLQATPVSVYRTVEGAAVGRWAHTQSLVNDALYVNQEVWLSFDQASRFIRIVKSNNVPLAHLFEGGRRVDLPPVAP